MSAPDDKFYRARVCQRTELGPTLWTMRVQVDGHFTFSPGQYATLGLEDVTKKRWERPYSIVSSPCENEVEFFLELVPGGDLTPLLHKLRLGDELLMRKAPKGRFTFDTTSGRTNHLLVSTVTGVAPFVSYARTLHHESKAGRMPGEHKLFLLHGASHASEFGYREELQRIVESMPWFKYVSTVSRPWEDPSWLGETGRVDDLVRKYADNWRLTAADSIAYLCGHPEMIEHCKAILRRAGFTKEWLREEVYWVPKKQGLDEPHPV